MSKLDDLLKIVNLLDNDSVAKENDAIHSHLIGKFVIIRTYASGVHVGYLKEFDAKNLCVQLSKSRRIWSWEGAFTLSAIANKGIEDGMLSDFVDDIIITQVCEILPTTSVVEKQLTTFTVYTP